MVSLSSFSNILKWDYSDIQDDPVYKNEVQANQVTALALLLCAIVMIAVCLMVVFGLMWYDKIGFVLITVLCVLILGIPALVCFHYKGRRGWIKFMLVLALLGVISILYLVLCVDVLILIPLPMVLSVRYFSKRLTLHTIAYTYIFFFFAVVFNVLVNVYINVTVLDLAGVTITVHDSLVDSIQQAAMDAYGDSYTSIVLNLEMLNDYIPNVLLLLLFSIICLSAASTGKRMMEEGMAIAESTARLKSELNTASDIQLGMLPERSSKKYEYDLCCSMIPAKEVGGDLYDYFMVDQNRLAVIVADVSGKGVPAALFMAITKTLLKDNLADMEPSEAVTRVNQMLCNNNKANLFVTAWVGVIDIKNNRLTFVNAGHNPPLIRHGNGDYEYLESDPDIVLAAMDGYQYTQVGRELIPGDRLFLYTDGVTEAKDSDNRMYGEERLREFLNSNEDIDPEQLVADLKDDIDRFACDVEQFDDMTMLSFYYENGREGQKEHIYEASASELPRVQEYVHEEVKDVGLSDTDLSMIKVCVDEVFANIASYAYPDREGSVKVVTDFKDGTFKLQFIDSGIPFNPLLKEDPDIEMSAEDREIGGLGILITKTYFDHMEYEYSGNQNILTLYKTWKVSE